MSIFGCPTRRAKHVKGAQDNDWLDAALRTGESGSRNSFSGQRTRKVCVLQTYTAQLANELSVTKGEIVHLLHHAKHWAYVVNSEGTRGYIPYAFCGDPPSSSRLSSSSQLRRNDSARATLLRDPSRQYEPNGRQAPVAQSHSTAGYSHQQMEYSSGSSGGSGIDALDLADTISLRSSMDPEMGRRMGVGPSMANVLPFFKVPYGQSAVLFDFEADDENDVTVRRGETVVILNQDDPNWVWVRGEDGREGFVPRMYICPCGCTSIHERIVESLQASMARHDANAAQQKRQRTEVYNQLQVSRPVVQNGGISQSMPRLYTRAERDPGRGAGDGATEPDAVRYSVKQAARAYSDTDISRASGGPQRSGFVPAIEEEQDEVDGTNFPESNSALENLNTKDHVRVNITADYEAQSKDEVSLRRGQWVFTTEEHLLYADDTDWLYVFTSERNTGGYIPKNCASALA